MQLLIIVLLLHYVVWTSAALQIHLSPSSCAANDCGPAIAAAIDRCSAAPPPCTITLASGDYRIACPTNVVRPSAAEIAHPAVAVNVSSVTFGGDGVGGRPQLLIDYEGAGCAGIVVTNAANVVIKSVIIDAYRLPFSVGVVISANASVVRFEIEDDAEAEGRVGTSVWDVARYPWLNTIKVAQAVVAGARATRQLPAVGLSSNNGATPYTSSVDASGRVVTLVFEGALAQRGYLARGTRIFLKHYDNMQSWGVHAADARGSLRIENVTLLSVAGMGFRADFSTCTYALLDSSIEIKRGTLRPMSITADGTHWMHHTGPITMRNVSVQGQGDDGFNIHGNFIMVVRRIDARTVEYIDEFGSGWIHAAPSRMLGDPVAFYSRRTLQRLPDSARVGHATSGTTVGSGNSIEWANASVVRFARDLPSNLKRFDMFLSLKRVASLVMEGCFFGNSNSRGVVLSAINATVRRTTFANLSNDGLTLIEGGCGCTAGDYTEGPFSKNVLIENNTFDSTSFVHDDNALHINNIAALQVTGCVPIGVCGDSGGALSSAPPFPFLLPSSEGGTLRIVTFAVPGAVLVSRLRYYDGRRVSDRSASPLPPLARSAMAIYSSLYSTGSGAIQSCDHPTKRLATASSRWTRDADGWWSAPLDGGSSLYLTNGTYFVAFVYAAGEAWHSAKAGGGEARYWKESAEQSARDPLPSNLVQNYSVWQNADAGFPIAALWSPVGQWCDAGGTLPPPFTPDNAGDIVVGWDRGHIQEPGNMLTGGRTFARNITILNNVFIAPKSDPWGGEWGNNFLHLGGVDGLVVRRNVMRRRAKRSNASGADVVVYSSTNVAVEGNRCELEGQAGELPCVMKNETTCAGALNKC